VATGRDRQATHDEWRIATGTNIVKSPRSITLPDQFSDGQKKIGDVMTDRMEEDVALKALENGRRMSKEMAVIRSRDLESAEFLATRARIDLERYHKEVRDFEEAIEKVMGR
jgi:hypothetical protein